MNAKLHALKHEVFIIKDMISMICWLWKDSVKAKLGGENLLMIDEECLAIWYKNILDFFKEEDIDSKALEKFHYFFKGQQISYPMKLYDKDLTADKIREIYKENPNVDVRELTEFYGFSTRWVKRIINEIEKGEP